MPQQDFGQEIARRKYYVEHQQKLEMGASATWEARHGEYQVSGIHAAIDLMAEVGMKSFYCEAQIEPNKIGQKASVKCCGHCGQFFD